MHHYCWCHISWSGVVYLNGSVRSNSTTHQAISNMVRIVYRNVDLPSLDPKSFVVLVSAMSVLLLGIIALIYRYKRPKGLNKISKHNDG
ncbi:MAG: hypothetical protein ACFFCZ_08615 [Promethearchaeota archaeon]